MKSHKAFQELYQKKSPKELADITGFSVSTFHKWSGVGESHRLNPLDCVSELTRAADDLVLVHWVCADAGGYFMRNVPPAAPAPELTPAMSQTIQETSKLIGEIATATKDGKITAEEAAGIRKRWEELKRVTEGFVLDCERGIFRLGAICGPFAYWLMTGDVPEMVAA